LQAACEAAERVVLAAWDALDPEHDGRPGYPDDPDDWDCGRAVILDGYVFARHGRGHLIRVRMDNVIRPD
jgi:hypothetical protein